MGTDEKAGNEIVGKLKLDIKALTLLYESDADLSRILERSFLESQEAYIARFVSMLHARDSAEDRGSLPVALGEIVLASFLTILGLAAFVPVMAGMTSSQQWSGYFSSAFAPSSGPLYFGVPVLDFAFAALLLLGAFYSLRRASKNLKNAGMVLEPGRS